MSKTVIVYSKNACPNCEHVKWALNSRGVPYEVRNIELPKDVDTLKERVKVDRHRREFDDYGYMAAPVTVFPDGDVLPGFDMGDFGRAIEKLGY